jgi:hypothetical protein
MTAEQERAEMLQAYVDYCGTTNEPISLLHWLRLRASRRSRTVLRRSGEVYQLTLATAHCPGDGLE